jgi:hypothetical protein
MPKKKVRAQHRRRRNDRPGQEHLCAFSASGELILSPNLRCPIKLAALSYNGSLPELVELTSRGAGEIALRVGVRGGLVELSVCGRKFSAQLVNFVENSPLQWLRAVDVFAALFPHATATT